MERLVDCDRHIQVSAAELRPFVGSPWSSYMGGRVHPFIQDVGDPRVAGRIKRPIAPGAGGVDPIGADVQVVFPAELLSAGLHPSRSYEVALARGYARWVTEAHLPEHPADRAMLYLPIGDVDACRDILAECGDRPGVVGAFVTNVGFPEMTANRYMELYGELQERRLVLGFHPLFVWREPPYEIFDRYLAVWALSYPFAQCAHLVNWLTHGMPERFPRLRCIFYEAGVSWLTMISHRFDQEFLRRPSEAPLLRERPSHYIGRYFYCTQPLDRSSDEADLEPPMRLVGCRQLVFGSSFPQWDFDTPSTIRRLPFLTGDEQAMILGENACSLFRLAVGTRRQGSEEAGIGEVGRA